MDISKGRISALTVMMYSQWRSFKEKLLKVMAENKKQKTEKNMIILELDLKSEFYGISKNEIRIYLKQLDVEP